MKPASSTQEWDYPFGIVLIVIGLLVWGAYAIPRSWNNKPDIKPEYHLEFVDQNTIKLYSISNNTLYTIPVDSLIYTLEIDNM